MNVSVYHKFLRVNALIVALMLVFDGGFVTPVSKQLSDNTIQYLANGLTSVSAQIEPTELNEITAELSEWERQLAAREASLGEREIPARTFDTGGIDYSTYILSTILFILTVLITLNYALDWSRMRQLRYEGKVT